MQDVEVPARVEAAGGRSARPAGSAGLRENRTVVVAAAFVVAVLLGVAIGYLTADRDSSSSNSHPTTATPAPELTPALRPAPWSNTRQPGTAHQMNVLQEPDPVKLRLALSWTVADAIKAADSHSTVTASQITVVDGMYFGAVEGPDAAHDEYWAIGRVEAPGVAELPPNPFVWQRVGTGPWTIVANGPTPNACDRIPQALVNLWKGPPPPCAG